ncbi:MAG: hypothetical protein MK066_09050 [Crocinitomicaceae bacterium]|nr:hypothetical protein [Crocinitomicaceae bacterium]
MEYFFIIALLIVCFYQDVKSRGIHWIIFPGLLAASIYMAKTYISVEQILYNLMYITFMLGALTIYLSIKKGRLTFPTDGYFAWGDILFLIAVTPLFSFQSFMLFFTIGTCVALIMHVLASIIKVQKSIPYAGYMAAFGIGYIFLEKTLLQFLTING